MVAGTAGACYRYYTTTPVALQGKPIECSLRLKEDLGGGVARLRFNLPTDRHVLGVGPGEHLLVMNNASLLRPYSPLTSDADAQGYFDLLVKLYPSGIVSRDLHSLRPGASLTFIGPKPGAFRLPVGGDLEKLGMVAGGTGIAPMYQLIRFLLHSQQHDSTRIVLVYSSRVEPPPLHHELEELACSFPGRLEVCYVLSGRSLEGQGKCEGGEKDKSPSVKKHSTTYRGRVTEKIIQDHLFSPHELLSESGTMLVSGPPGLREALCGRGSRDGTNGSQPPLGGLLKRMGYSDHTVVRL